VAVTTGAGATAQWPTVAADDWCGEYKAKDATRAAHGATGRYAVRTRSAQGPPPR
jgi:hypothetical protein